MTVSEDLASVLEGDPIVTVGAVLSSVNVLEGPAAAAVFPAESEAVAAAREIPTAPSPEQDDRVTVRVAEPAPLTAAEQAAVPDALTVMSALAKVTAEAPV